MFEGKTMYTLLYKCFGIYRDTPGTTGQTGPTGPPQHLNIEKEIETRNTKRLIT